MQNSGSSNLDINLKYLKNNYNCHKTRAAQNSHIIFFAGIIASLNVLFSNNYIVSLIVVGFELAVLTYYFAKKDITKYIGNYLIFLCLSFEFDILVGSDEFYGFKNFRILGINLGILALLPIAILAIFKKIKIKEIKEEFPHIYKFATVLIFMNVTGFIMGLFQILINDNNIQNMENMFSTFIGISYNMIAMLLLMITAIAYILTWEKDKLDQLNSYLTAILIGVVISMIVSLATGNFGWYGGVDTLLVTNVIRYIPFMLLLPFYKNCKSQKTLIIIFAIIGLVLSLMYNATGKIIIIYLLVPIAVCVILWKRKKILPLMLTLLILPIIVVLSIQAVDILASNSVLFNVKLTQALSLLKFWDSNWLINMPSSPRTRIIEFINIVYEYLQKPWMFLLGKGYMGTITDHIGMLGTTFIPYSYSINEWNNGTFYGVHETFNILFLYNGLLGIVFYFYMLKFVLTNFTKSPWILIGGFWFLMVYGFSVTMSAFGIVALLLGYSELDTYKRGCK